MNNEVINEKASTADDITDTHGHLVERDGKFT